MKNQTGFATLSLLTLLPLLLAIAAFAAGSFLMLKENRRAHFECRAGLLDAQNRLIHDMNKLLDLNKTARALKIQRRAAEAAVLASVASPAQLALAKQALLLIMNQQRMLDLTQRTLIAKANLNVRAKTRETSNKVSKHVRRTRTPKLAVTPVQTGDVAPEYQPDPDIESQHVIRISWEFRPLEGLPDWLNRLLAQKPIVLETECSTTTKKGSKRWESKLTKDKRFLSSALF